jgi:hypothetical protein
LVQWSGQKVYAIIPRYPREEVPEMWRNRITVVCLSLIMLVHASPTDLKAAQESRAQSATREPRDKTQRETAEEIQRLVDQLGDDQFAAREAASKRLGEIGAAALPALRRAAQSTSAEVRSRARMLLAQIPKGTGPAEKKGQGERLSPPRAATAEEIRRLVARLGDNDQRVRAAAKRALLEIGPEALPALRDAAKSSDPEVRRCALWHLNLAAALAQPQALLLKSIDPACLADSFKLVGVTRVFDINNGGSSLHLTLEAIREVDTSYLRYKAGFFDDNNLVQVSSDIRFQAAFLLLKGEMVKAICWEGPEPRVWRKIAIRKSDTPVPKR